MSAHTPGIIHREIDPLSDAGEREANSRLIAAAPDLLAFCKQLLAVNIALPMGFLEQLKAAIARAEGRAE